MRRNLAALTLGAFFLASGCTSITRAGNSVLETVGLKEEPQCFSQAKRLEYVTTDLSPENEYYIGRAVSAKLFGIFKEHDDPALREYVSYVLSAVAAASDRPVTFRGYRVVIVESEQVNALSAPGGFIFITTGMLERLPDEDALAAVLAHEVSHVEHQHGIHSISRDRLSEALQSLGIVAGSLYCGQVVQQALAVFNAAADDVVRTLVERGYSRDQEFEADAGSVRMLRKAGYNPYALTSVLEQLKQVEGKHSGGWFATHPPAGARLGAVSETLTEADRRTTEQARSKRFQKFAGRLSRT